MYKVKFTSTGNVYDLEGFNGSKIIIRFNGGASVGTVERRGYEPLNIIGGWPTLETLLLGEELKRKIDNV